MHALLLRVTVLIIAILLIPTPSQAQDTPGHTLTHGAKKKAPAADAALKCDDTAVLWRIEYGETHYAEAYCKAGCSEYQSRDERFTKDALKACTKGVEAVTKTFYGSPKQGLNCLEIKRDIQLIRAWHGRDFDGVAWKDHFKTHYDWYGKRSKVKYSSTASAIRKELEGLRAKCYKMSTDEKRYASTLISALKRRKISGKQPLIRYDTESSEPHVKILRGKSRHEVVAQGYKRMIDYKPTVLDTPAQIFTELTDSERSEIPQKLRGLKYKARIEIGGSRISSYCDHFHGDERCGGGGMYTAYYFNEDAEIIATHSYGVACPFVYTRDTDESWSFQGEILRDLRRPSLEDSQTLSVRIAPQECERGVVHIKIAEEKPETTWLDAVYMQVGEDIVRPAMCVATSEEAMCEDDARYKVIERGEELLLEFHLPGESSRSSCLAQDVTLHANGYYVPTL